MTKKTDSFSVHDNETCLANMVYKIKQQ